MMNGRKLHSNPSTQPKQAPRCKKKSFSPQNQSLRAQKWGSLSDGCSVPDTVLYWSLCDSSWFTRGGHRYKPGVKQISPTTLPFSAPETTVWFGSSDFATIAVSNKCFVVVQARVGKIAVVLLTPTSFACTVCLGSLSSCCQRWSRS